MLGSDIALERFQPVEGSTELEGALPLQDLELQQDVATGYALEHRRVDHRGSEHDAGQSLLGGPKQRYPLTPQTFSRRLRSLARAVQASDSTHDVFLAHGVTTGDAGGDSICSQPPLSGRGKCQKCRSSYGSLNSISPNRRLSAPSRNNFAMMGHTPGITESGCPASASRTISASEPLPRIALKTLPTSRSTPTRSRLPVRTCSTTISGS